MTRLTSEQILHLTITEALCYMKKGKLTSERYVKVLFRQILKYNRKGDTNGINVILFYNKKASIKRARRLDQLRSCGKIIGALHGIPLLIKDSFNTESIPTTAATDGLRINIPSEDAPVVKSLIDAGAIVIGKTNLAEISLALTVPNTNFAGVCKNPYNLNFTSGGSSGGSAAGVAAYFAPASIGEDTGGSIRCPAMCCGVYGFRPTTYRYSQSGIVPVGSGFDTAGPMTRSVNDLILLDSVITGDCKKYKFKKIRIGIPRRFFYQELTPEVEISINNALSKLRRCGIELVEVDVPSDFTTDSADLLTILTGEFNRDFTAYLDREIADPNNPLLPTTTQQIIDQVQTPVIKTFAEILMVPAPPEVIALAKERQAQQKQIWVRYFKDNKLDAVFVPSSTHVALPLSVDAAEAFNIYVRNFAVAAFNSLPALNIPIGLTENGLPVGGEIIGSHGKDRKLLAIGKIFEKILGRIPGPSRF